MRVALLKNQTQSYDPYEDLLIKNGHVPHFIPLITHTQIPQELEEYLTSGEIAEYIIITSQRTVETIQNLLPHLPQLVAQKLLNTTIFTVGPASAKFLRRVGFANVLGEECGNGSILSQYILQTIPENYTREIIFLVGEIRRDIIPKALSNCKLREIVTYKTENLPNVKIDVDVDCVVFFSPQGTEVIVEWLRSNPRNIISIGPTTTEYLKTKSIPVVITCEKPDSASLINALRHYN